MIRHFVKLGDVCTVIAGQSPPGDTYRKEPLGLPFFQGKADFGIRYPVARVWCIQPTKKAQTGDILISVRAPVGPTNVADCECCIGRGLAAIRPHQQADRDYVLHVLRYFQGSLERMGSGSTFAAITTKHLNEFLIPLPPLAEQKRIAAILDEADVLRRKRRETVAKLDTLLQSVFLDMFGDPVKNSKGWKAERFETLLSIPLRNGVSPSNVGKYRGKVLTLSAITRGSFDPTAVKDAPFAEEASDEKLVNTLDFLICRGNGNLGMVGRAHFPTQIFQDTVFPDTMIAARVDEKRIVPQFLETFWSTKNVRRQIESVARTTNGTYKVNQGMLEAIEVLVPPFRLQEEFASRIIEINSMREKQEASLNRLETLFNGLQHQAFSASSNGTTAEQLPIQPCLTLDF